MRSAIAALLVLSSVATAEAQVDPAFNDTRLKVPSAELHLFFARQPVVVDGVVLVPLAAVERWLKTTAEEQTDGSLLITYYGQTRTAVRIQMWPGQKRGVIGRAEVPLDAAPQRIDDVMYVPLRFVAEAVGVWVDAIDHRIRLKKPDLNWECWLAIPPHPKSLQGKLVALAVARQGEKLKRVQSVSLSEDTMSGQVLIAEPNGDKPVKHLLTYRRDGTGWHFLGQVPFNQ
jgi:hypothetical protein